MQGHLLPARLCDHVPHGIQVIPPQASPWHRHSRPAFGPHHRQRGPAVWLTRFCCCCFPLFKIHCILDKLSISPCLLCTYMYVLLWMCVIHHCKKTLSRTVGRMGICIHYIHQSLPQSSNRQRWKSHRQLFRPCWGLSVWYTDGRCVGCLESRAGTGCRRLRVTVGGY